MKISSSTCAQHEKARADRGRDLGRRRRRGRGVGEETASSAEEEKAGADSRRADAEDAGCSSRRTEDESRRTEDENTEAEGRRTEAEGRRTEAEGRRAEAETKEAEAQSGISSDVEEGGAATRGEAGKRPLEDVPAWVEEVLRFKESQFIYDRKKYRSLRAALLAGPGLLDLYSGARGLCYGLRWKWMPMGFVLRSEAWRG